MCEPHRDRMARSDDARSVERNRLARSHRPDGGRPVFYAWPNSHCHGPARRHAPPACPGPLTVVLFAEISVDIEATVAAAATAFERVVNYFGSAVFPLHGARRVPGTLSPRHRYDSAWSISTAARSTCRVTGHLDLVFRGRSPACHLQLRASRRARLIPKRAFGEGYYPFTWELAPVMTRSGSARASGSTRPSRRWPPAKPTRARIGNACSTVDSGPRSPRCRRFSAGCLLWSSRVIASTRYSSDFRTRSDIVCARSADGRRDGRSDAPADGRAQATARRASPHVAWSARERRVSGLVKIPAISKSDRRRDARQSSSAWNRAAP